MGFLCKHGTIFIVLSNFVLFAQSGTIRGDGESDHTLNIGLLLPYSEGWTVGQKIGAAIVVAMEKVKQERILPEYKIDFQWSDTKCAAYDGLTGALELWNSFKDLDVFIGGGCSVVCEPVALVAAVWNLPHISWGCNSADLSDKLKYPTFSRTVGPWVSLAPAVADLMDTFDWKRAGIVATSENIMQLTANSFRDELQRREIDVYRHDIKNVVDHSTVVLDRLEKMRSVVQSIKKNTKIIILIMGSRDINNFLLLARGEEMLDGDFVFISIDVDADTNAEGPGNAAALVEAYQGFISFNLRKPSGPVWDEFATAVVEQFHNFDAMAAPLTADQVDVHAAMLHDAVLMWAHGVRLTINERGDSYLDNGLEVTSRLKNFTFEGLSGHVVIDENGDRKPDYSIQILQDGTFVTLLDIVPIKNSKHAQAKVFPGVKFGKQTESDSLTKVYKPDAPNDWSGIKWANGRTTIPTGEPKCGWNNEHCSKTVIIIVLVCVALVIVGTIFLFFAKRRVEYEREVYNEELWRIQWSEVQQNQIASQVKNVLETYSKIRASQRAALQAKKTRKHLGDGTDTLSRTIVARHKGMNVMVKQLNRSSVDVHSYGRKLLLEIKQMRDLKHENVNPFVAACADAPDVCILMAYCSKGSLQEVLHNEAYSLPWDYRTSVANDIAKGMHYLYKSPLKSHGSLNSNNVVIDSRWVAKVTDYGLAAFKEGIPKNIESELWVAPELLRMGPTRPAKGTPEGDVYSFAIILSEIVTRDLPFAKNNLEYNVEGIVDRVKQFTPSFKCRPFIPEDACSFYWTRLMKYCWTELPIDRLTFKTIKIKIKEINKGKEISVMDNMLNMLEHHSEQLEEILEEKTSLLERERHKSEMLFLARVPRDIMKTVEDGDIPDAEKFEHLTLLQTGLARFPDLIADLPASDVSFMLSTLWWNMDTLCSAHGDDLYKTDTAASDGEMVVFRSLKDSGSAGAEKLATIALNMLCEVQAVSKVPSLQGALVPWRAALHTGRCAGLVLGQRVPRYCLLGEAVNTTKELLSHCPGLKILVSDTTENFLQEKEAFSFQRNEAHKKMGLSTPSSFWLESHIEMDESNFPDPTKGLYYTAQETQSQEPIYDNAPPIRSGTVSREEPVYENIQAFATKSASKERPSKSASNERPAKSASKERPVFSASNERPAKSASNERPVFSASNERPVFSANSERPAKSASNERPVFSASNERPAKSTGDESDEEPSTFV